MDFTNLENILKGQPAYRLKQAEKEIFHNLAEDWLKAGSLPFLLREKLNKTVPLSIKAKTFTSKDAIKALITLEDGLKIETVLMRHLGGRNTVCVSSQVGCPLACQFCATGKMGLKRNLEAFEIVEQVLFFSRYLKQKGSKVTNIVFMGMGEPFLNYDNVIGAIKTLNDKDGFNLGARHFSISTVGVTEGIKKLAQERLQVNLAVSIHAPTDKLRSKIIPANKKYPIKEILKAVDGYIAKTKRRVMFEYLMIDGLNDSDECAENLARLMKKPLYFVNLISYNSTCDFRPSSPQRIKRFKEILEKEGVVVTQRYRFGQDIKAACGQLAGTRF